MHLNAAKDSIPLSGSFELTERCNLHCKMCYVCSSNSSNLKKLELCSSTWVDIAKQAIDQGMLFLTLTGGEIFYRPDFFDIYLPITQLGVIISLFSNGTLITEEIALKLAENSPNRIEISLYGASQAVYESITGIPGSYRSCCSGIELLLKYKLPVSLKTTLTKLNRHELDDMRRMAKDWDIPFVAGNLVSLRRDLQESDSDEYRLSPEECVNMEASDIESFEYWEEKIEKYNKVIVKNNLQVFDCYAGKASFSVNYQGEMNLCTLLPQPSISIPTEGFDRAWKGLKEFINKTPSLSPSCSACELAFYCPKCPAWSYTENRVFGSPVQYLCEIAKLRKEIFCKGG